MITLIIFLSAVILIYISNMVVFYNTYSWWIISLLVIGAVVGMVLVNAIIAIVTCKMLPDKWYSMNKKIFMVSKREIKFYEKIGIKKWKDKTAELGALNGFKKDKIVNFDDPEYVKQFILETNKGFIDHFISMIVSIIVAFIMPIKFWFVLSIPVAITSVILNLISVVVLRYNMPRLRTLLKFAERKQSNQNPINK